MERLFASRLAKLTLIVALLVGSLAGVALVSAGGPTATVNSYALNVRTGPSINYARVVSVPRGTALTLLARNADTSWVKVSVYTGVVGWVSVPFIYTTYPLSSLPVESGGPVVEPTGIVNTHGLNVRAGPGVGYARVTAISLGTSVILKTRNADASWVKIQLFDGRQGWVNSRYITTTYPFMSLPIEGGTTPPPPPATRTHVVQPGENLFRIGLRYGVSMYDIAQANGITNLALIYAGQVLIIP